MGREGGREVKETRIRKRGGDGNWKRNKKVIEVRPSGGNEQRKWFESD